MRSVTEAMREATGLLEAAEVFQSSSSASVYFQAAGEDFYSALAMNGCLLLEDLRRSRCTGGSLSILKRRSLARLLNGGCGVRIWLYIWQNSN